ncbi:hypothetical protein OKW34_003689 [Paraburkholderia youngii]
MINGQPVRFYQGAFTCDPRTCRPTDCGLAARALSESVLQCELKDAPRQKNWRLSGARNLPASVQVVPRDGRTASVRLSPGCGRSHPQKVLRMRSSPARGSSQKYASSAVIVIMHSTGRFWKTRENATPTRLASTCAASSTVSAVSIGGKGGASDQVTMIFAQVMHFGCGHSGRVAGLGEPLRTAWKPVVLNASCALTTGVCH